MEICLTLSNLADPTNFYSFISKLHVWASSTSRYLLIHKTLFFYAEFIINSFLTSYPLVPAETSKRLISLPLDFSSAIYYFKQKDYRLNLVKSYLFIAHSKLLLNLESDARSLLTSAKASASSIFIPKETQNYIDFLSGLILFRVGELTLSTVSFLDSVESGNSEALKFFVLAKILSSDFDDARRKLRKYLEFSKLTIAQSEVEKLSLICRVGNAVLSKDLSSFSACLKILREQKKDFYDEIIFEKVQNMFESVLEKNLKDILDVYSTIRIQKIKDIIGVSYDDVEKKIFDFIVKGKLDGRIDEEKGLFIKEKKKRDHHSEYMKESKLVLEYILHNIRKIENLNLKLKKEEEIYHKSREKELNK